MLPLGVWGKGPRNYGAAGDRPQVIWANGVLASTAVGVFTQLLTPWRAAHSPTVYLEYDGNLGTLKSSSRLEYMKAKKCSHFSALHDLGDPFWTPAEGKTVAAAKSKAMSKLKKKLLSRTRTYNPPV